MSLTDTLLARIEAHCAAHGISEREFGLRVANNHKLVVRLRNGCGVNSQSHDRIVAFIEGRPVDPPKPKRRQFVQAQEAA
jgi:hypothetical protein